tara:strand:+ start:309 stop:1076 length:768 start_codon:yes stop_codon:yes gene_type:complete
MLLHNQKHKIGIVIVATNAYFILGLRLVNRFNNFYSGFSQIKFYFFSDQDPAPYLHKEINISYINQKHSNWVDGVNSKFKNILSLEDSDCDYIYFLDSDTNINNPFNEWSILGDLVGGEHFGNKTWMKDVKNYDRNPRSSAYVPYNTELPQTYYLGAFFGGKKENVIEMCKVMCEWQEHNKKISHEPGVNDESYLNKYFHYNPPKTIPIEKFPFVISDKGGMHNTREPSLDISNLVEGANERKYSLWDIKFNKIV